ncbi:MAG: DUF502 domain-containing protein [Phycisphaera sp.]|nr:DUF502 domain-containing protein [Phycisphaera sp.]
MQAIKRFIKTSLIGGLIVLLPLGILAAVFSWIYGVLKGLVEPFTRRIMESNPTVEENVAVVLVLAIIVGLCFVIGVLVRTSVGRFMHEQFEKRVMKVAPGYKLIKETVLQFLGNRPSPFSSVALVQLWGNDTLVTAFVTERHDNGWYSVFVPTGPNPTSGGIFHVRPEYVHHLDHPVDDVMRVIISCGAGSAALLKHAKTGPAATPNDGGGASGV